MSVTRAEIRQEAADSISGDLLTSESTGGTTTTLVDTERLLDANESPNRYLGSWLNISDGDYAGTVRRIGSYLNGSGTVVWSAALAGALPAGVKYELHDHLDPRQWNASINRALRRLTRDRLDPLPIVRDRRQYSLAMLSTLEMETSVQRLWLRWGDPGEKQWEELEPHKWRVYRDMDMFVLDLKSPLSPDSTNTLQLVVEWIGSYEPLNHDLARTSCPIDWVVAATLVEAWERYGRTINEKVREAVQTDQTKAMQTLTSLTHKYGPNVARPLRGPEW